MEIITYNKNHKMPSTNFPKIAILFGKEGEQYSINSDYINAIISFDAIPILVAYENVYEDLKNINPDGVLVIGGDFKFPKSWYVEDVDSPEEMNERCNAYVEMFRFAENYKIPTLGICAGMQILGILNGAKLTRLNNPQKHKTQNLHAHNVAIKENTLLHKIAKKDTISVNSRHFEALKIKENEKIIISAIDSVDNTIEAIELENPWNEFVLGIQWHPETLLNKENDPISKEIFKSFINASIKQKNAPI